MLVVEILLASAIALGNVLLPAVVKQHFPTRQSRVTGAYATTMGLAAAIAPGVAVPLATIAPGGWRTALGAWAGNAPVTGLIEVRQSSPQGYPSAHAYPSAPR